MTGKQEQPWQEWFTKAEQDMEIVELLLTHKGYPSAAGFHLQQALEKYIKGYLLSRGWGLRRVHDLEVLLNEALAYHRSWEQFRSICQRVSQYYLQQRYPLGTGAELTVEEVEGALVRVKPLIETIVRSVRPR